MKLLLLLVAFQLSGVAFLQAQNDSSFISSSSEKHLVSSAAVRLFDRQIIKGWLYEVNDSQLVILNIRKGKLKKLNDPDFDLAGKTTVMAVDKIKSISVQRKNAGLKGALLGIAAGVLTGVIMGYAEGDDPIMQYDAATDPWFAGIGVALSNAFAMTAGEKAVAYGGFFGVCGGVTGLVIGALAKKKFTIVGKKERFHDLEGELMRRLVIK